MKVNTVIRNCHIVGPDRIFQAGLAIDEGKIVAIGRDDSLPNAENIIDARGKYIIPGLVDAHVHLEWPPGVDIIKNIRAETQACAFGGITTLIHLLAPAEDILQHMEEFISVYERHAYVDLDLSTRIYTWEDIKQIHQLLRRGVRGFKLLLPYKGPEAVWKGRVGGVDDGIVFLAFKEIARLVNQGYKVFARVHCENVEIFLRLRERYQQQGLEPASWDEVRPRYCEEEAMGRCIYLASKTGCPIYIVHMSIKEGIDLVAEAKSKGIDVTAETCIQYLVLNVNNTDKTLSKVNPPIRGPEDNERLWEGIRRGIISVVATDHAPVNQVDKVNLWEALPGFSGVETLLPLMLSEGVNKERISLEKLVEVCCYNPARIFGLFPSKGVISVGSDADLVIIDLEKEMMVSERPFYSASDFSPYAGWKLKGWPELVMLRGKTIMKEGQVVGRPGYGRYVGMGKERCTTPPN